MKIWQKSSRKRFTSCIKSANFRFFSPLPNRKQTKIPLKATNLRGFRGFSLRFYISPNRHLVQFGILVRWIDCAELLRIVSACILHSIPDCSRLNTSILHSMPLFRRGLVSLFMDKIKPPALFKQAANNPE